MRNVQPANWIDNLQQVLERYVLSRLRRESSITPRRAIQVDYRDRISVVTWLIVFGLGASILLDVPTAILTFSALGSPISIPFRERIIAAIFMAILAAAGTQSVMSVHPFFANSRRGQAQTWAFWALPSAI